MSAMLKSSIQTLGQLTDPEEQKEQILKDVGDLRDAHYRIYDDHVLVAIYVTPSTVAIKRDDGSTYNFQLTDRKVGESEHQGKAALVLKIGPTAWKYTAWGHEYQGESPEVGDWVIVNPSDGRSVGLKSPNGREHVICRLIPASAIRHGVKDPRRVY